MTFVGSRDELHWLLRRARNGQPVDTHEVPRMIARGKQIQATRADANIAPTVGRKLLKEMPIASGDRRPWVYQDGAYVPGEDILRTRIRTMLGKRWSVAVANSTIQWLIDGPTKLWDGKIAPIDTVNLRNCMLAVDERSVTKLNHTPEHLTPVQLPVTYDPDADCPGIKAFLSEVFTKQALWVAIEWAGLLMFPDTSFEKALILYGPAGTGKSTYLHVLRSFLGRDNVSHRSLHEIVENRFATADLYGKLANIYADLDPADIKQTGKLQMITSGDPMSAERKNQQAFSFMPYARLLFSCNDIPAAPSSGEAYLDRWTPVYMGERFRGTSQQKRAKWKELTTSQELSGFLNLAIKGRQRLLRRGHFTFGGELERAATEFAVASDTVRAWLEDAGWAPEIGTTQTHRSVWNDYASWCYTNELPRASARNFHPRFRAAARAAGWNWIEPEIEGDQCYRWLAPE